MQFNALLDVAIGLTLLYLVISLFVTIINEWISSVFKLRARNLRRGLRELLDDPNVRQLFEGSATYRSFQRASGEMRWVHLQAVGPSYLPSDRFASAVLEALAKAGDAKLSELKPEKLQEIVAALPTSLIRDQLTVLITEGGESLEAIENKLAHWFDDMMDRASGVFRRWMQLVSFLVASGISIFLNVDTIYVGAKLWEDEPLRAQLVESAQHFMGDRSEIEVLAEIKDLQGELRPYPIGWTQERLVEVFSGSLIFVGTLFGWFLTAAAASLGAPFWFGVLEKLTKLRGVGNKPPKSEDRNLSAPHGATEDP